MVNFLTGYKTYIVAAGMAAYAIIGYSLGYIDATVMAQRLLEAAAFAGLRLGISSSK